VSDSSPSLRLFLTALAMFVVGALLARGDWADRRGAHSRRAPLTALVCADAHAAVEQSASSHADLQASLDVADEDSPDEELLVASPSSTLPRAFGHRVTVCPSQTFSSHEPHLTLDRPPRA
jgi:hypothetical protein